MREVEASETVTCRPHWIVSILAGFYFLITVGAGWAQSVPDKYGNPEPLLLRLFMAVAGAGFLIYGLQGMLHVLRYRVVADAGGLRWRGAWSGWQTATWDDVCDYYDEVRTDTAQSKRVICPTIVTRSGTVPVAADCANLDELRHIVRKQATAARVTEWEPLGVRRVDAWPRTFHYWNDASPYKFTLSLLGGVVVLGAIAWGFIHLVSWFAKLSSASEVRSVILALGCGYAILVGVMVRVIWYYCTLWNRRNEVITVTPETVRYDNPVIGETIDVSWKDISDYFYGICNKGRIHDGYSLVVSGADEKQITWKPDLIASGLLIAIVQHYAPTPKNHSREESGWRSKSPHEATGGSDPATWQSGAVGMGGRRFTNRSAINKFMLTFCTCMIMAFPFGAVQEWNKPNHGDYLAPLQIMTVFATPLIWAWICFIRTRVETDDMGITHYTPFGKKYLPWFTIADYTGFKDGGSFTLFAQNGKRMHFYSLLNGYEELRGEVERYAPPPKTGWKKIPNRFGR